MVKGSVEREDQDRRVYAVGWRARASERIELQFGQIVHMDGDGDLQRS